MKDVVEAYKEALLQSGTDWKQIPTIAARAEYTLAALLADDLQLVGAG